MQFAAGHMLLILSLDLRLVLLPTLHRTALFTRNVQRQWCHTTIAPITSARLTVFTVCVLYLHVVVKYN